MVERNEGFSKFQSLNTTESLLSPELRKQSLVTVLYGGISSERPGSIESSQTIAGLLLQSGYSHVQRLDITPDTILSLSDKKKIGTAFIALHGGFGEDGTIQGLLEMLDIPYTGSGVAASSISADKTLFNNFVRGLGYNVANQMTATSVEELSTLSLKYPKVLKPASQGCSYGVFFVRSRDELLDRAAFTQKFDERMIVEDYIDGRELTVGLFEDPLSEKPQTLPILENILSREILDYETKYPGGEHLYKAVIPAKLDPSVQRSIEEICADIFLRLHCHGYVRIDLRLNKQGEIYILENNTSPGMLSFEESDFPKMVLAAGIDPAKFVDLMVQGALNNYSKKKEKKSQTPSEKEMVEYLGIKFSE